MTNHFWDQVMSHGEATGATPAPQDTSDVERVAFELYRQAGGMDSPRMSSASDREFYLPRAQAILDAAGAPAGPPLHEPTDRDQGDVPSDEDRVREYVKALVSELTSNMPADERLRIARACVAVEDQLTAELRAERDGAYADAAYAEECARAALERAEQAEARVARLTEQLQHECPHHEMSWTGVDQSDGDDKEWRCDNCGKAGLHSEDRGREIEATPMQQPDTIPSDEERVREYAEALDRSLTQWMRSVWTDREPYDPQQIIEAVEVLIDVEAARACVEVEDRHTAAKCTCYPFGFTPDTYEGPQEDCPEHGRPYAEWVERATEAEAEVERQAALLDAINDCHRDPARAILQADKIAGAAILRAERAEAEAERMRDFAKLAEVDAEATIARVEAVCRNTDGEWLAGEAEIPVGEVQAALRGPDAVQDVRGL